MASKWQNSTTDPAGPIQVKRVNDALSKLRWEHGTYVELYGIVGVDERSSTLTAMNIGGGGTVCEDVKAAQERVGEKYQYTVSRATAVEIVADLERELAAVQLTRPVHDKRRTPEQERVEHEKHQQYDRERAERERREHEAFIRLYGSGEQVTVHPGEMAITARITFDDSDSMSDYFSPHHGLSPKFCLMVVGKQAETERLARSAVARIELLKDVPFKWHTEKYSMGHGNYLISEYFDLPAEVQGIRSLYRGGKVTRGTWEIEFERDSRQATEFPAIRGYGGVYSGVDLASKDGEAAAYQARNGDGNAVGTAVVVRENVEKDGVELHFQDKPDASVLATLKDNGWRWSRFGNCWYKRASQEAREFAHGMAQSAVKSSVENSVESSAVPETASHPVD